MSYFLTWIALMGLLGLTLASSYVPLGAWNGTLNLGIAGAKALLIALFFMHLRHAAALLRIAGLTAIVWLVLLFALSWTDMATRTISPAPWSAPR